MQTRSHVHFVDFQCLKGHQTHTPVLSVVLPDCTLVAVKWHLRDEFWSEPPPRLVTMSRKEE